MCSWRYPEGRTSSCRYVWPQRLFGKSRRNPHQHFITTQIVKNNNGADQLTLILTGPRHLHETRVGKNRARLQFCMQHSSTAMQHLCTSTGTARLFSPFDYFARILVQLSAAWERHCGDHVSVNRFIQVSIEQF